MGTRYRIAAILVFAGFVAPVAAQSTHMQWLNELKGIQSARANYDETYRQLPQDIVDSGGKPLLSWRVAVLPHVEHDDLYQRLQRREPWDSAANKALVAERNPFRNPLLYKATTLSGVVM